MIEIKNLKKSFNQNEVLRGINLSINDNEIVSIIGSSGGGNLHFSDALISWKRQIQEV